MAFSPTWGRKAFRGSGVQGGFLFDLGLSDTSRGSVPLPNIYAFPFLSTCLHGIIIEARDNCGRVQL
eukprot:s2832_g5.t1